MANKNPLGRPNAGRPPRTVRRGAWPFRRVLLTMFLVLVAAVLAASIVPTTRWVDGAGYLMTDLEAELRPSVDGVIESSPVRDCDSVPKGQLVIQLRDDSQRMACEQARQELKGKRAELDCLATAQSLELLQRREQILQAELKLKLNRDRLQKMQKATSGAFSRQEINQAKLEVDLAESRLVELRLPREEVMGKQIEVLRQQIKAAEKRVARYDAEVRLRQIRSPLAGVVYFNRFEVGEVVKPEHVLGQVFDPSLWIVRLKISERYIIYVQPGQSVRVELAAYPSLRYGHLKATVSQVLPVVSPQATGDGIFYVEARLDDSTRLRLQPGMTAEASIDTGGTNWLFRILGW